MSRGCAGRERELDELAQRYRDAQRGEPLSPRLVLLEGPSGIGKTQIITELKGRVRLQGGVVLEGRCESGLAFGPFAEIVDRSLRFLDEVGVTPKVDLSGLACRGGCHRLWHQHGGRDAGPVPYRDESLPGATDETTVFEMRLRFFDTIAGLLAEVAQLRAPLIVLDHLEKADRGSRDLLAFLLDSASPIPGRSPLLRALFVGSRRTEKTPPTRLSFPEHLPVARIVVGRLDLDGVRAYVQSHAALEKVLERTGGVPEAIDRLLEGQPLTPADRVARRLAELGRGKPLVEALAVLGRPSDLETLSQITRVSVDAHVRHALSGSVLLSRSLVGGRVLFAFDRDVEAELCVGLLESDRRRELHRACADVCAESIDLQEAVRHAILGEEMTRALDLALNAAAGLSARHAQGEAAALLEGVIEACESGTPQSVEPVRERLTQLYRVAGEYGRALAHARILREQRQDCPRAAHRVGQLLTAAGEHEEAAEVLTEALALVEQLSAGAGNVPSVRAEVEAQLAELYYQSAHYQDAALHGEKALEHALASNELEVAISARNTLGKLALAQKEPAEAARLFAANRDAAAASALGHQEAQAHTNHAVALLLGRDLRGAEQACHIAIEVADRVCDTRERAIATENLAVIAHLGRDYGNALTHYHQAVALLKRLGNRAMLTRVANNLGELYLSLGERERARGLGEFGTRIGRKLPSTVLAENLLLRGRIDAADGKISEARQALTEAKHRFARLESTRVVDPSIELARLALFDGDVPTARGILANLPPELPARHQADLALVRADLERASGDDARVATRRAVELAEACGDDERLLKALIRRARALGDAEEIEQATRALERAQGLEEELTTRVPEESRGAWAERPLRRQLTQVAGQLASAWTRTRHESVPPPRALTTRPSDRAPATPHRDPRWQKRYPSIVGRSRGLSQVLRVLDKVARSEALVLIRGESGTGKELVADAIHKNSRRHSRPFVKVNCAALVETLLMSELFGHEKGSFTGASARKKGRFELADGGTIFLDEIGDISPKTQVALLRVLQERRFERVGGTEAVEVDVRIIAATHRNLEEMVEEGSFREDLYYRLRGVMIGVPPLRERLTDLPDLCEHLLQQIAREQGSSPRRMSPEALETLARHTWPGNIRELENVLRSATLFADGTFLVPEDFAAFSNSFRKAAPDEATPTGSGITELSPTTAETLAAAQRSESLERLLYRRIRDGETSLLEMKKVMERECIVRALEETDGNITRAAALLGMKRPRLSQLAKQYGLSKKGGGTKC